MPLAQELTEFTTASPVIASYDWQSFVTNNEYVDFYAMGTESSTGIDYHFTDAIKFSDPNTYGTFIAGGTSGIQGSAATNYIEFETSPFDRAITIEGDAIIKLRWALERTGQAGSGTGAATLTLYNGATSLGTVTTAQSASTANGAISETTSALLMTIAQAHIAAGTTLKLRVGCNFVVSYHYLHLSFDPEVTDDMLKVSLPFKIQI